MNKSVRSILAIAALFAASTAPQAPAITWTRIGVLAQPRLVSAAQGALATVSLTTDSEQAASCSEQIAELRRIALRNHQATPDTVWQARSYAQLMFAADLALAEAQVAEGSNDECLLAARRAKEELPSG